MAVQLWKDNSRAAVLLSPISLPLDAVGYCFSLITCKEQEEQEQETIRIRIIIIIIIIIMSLVVDYYYLIHFPMIPISSLPSFWAPQSQG